MQQRKRGKENEESRSEMAEGKHDGEARRNALLDMRRGAAIRSIGSRGRARVPGLPRSGLRDGRNAGRDGLRGHRMPPEPCRSRHGAFRGRRPRDGLVHGAHLKPESGETALRGCFSLRNAFRRMYTHCRKNPLKIPKYTRVFACYMCLSEAYMYMKKENRASKERGFQK